MSFSLRAGAVAGAADLSRLPIGLDLRGISIAEGVRAALAVAVLVAANEWLAWPPMMEAALGALMTCLCDAGGPVRTRLPALLAFGLIGAALTGGMGLARAAGPAVALPLAGLVIFAAGFARVHGTVAQQVGTLLSVVLVLAFDRALPDVATALELAGAFLGGSLWALVLTMLIWRVRPFGPARAAVAEAFRRLSLLAGDLQRLAASPAERTAWEAHGRAHRGAVRGAIEQARLLVMETLRIRGPVSARARQSLIRLEAADQIFGALIALSEVCEQTLDPATRAGLVRVLRRVRPLLAVLSRQIAADLAGQTGRLDAKLVAIAAETAALDPAGPAAPALDALIERLLVAVAVPPPSGLQPADPTGPGPGRWARFVAPIRANLAWRSDALRHALRAAVVAVPALLLTMVWAPAGVGRYEHWLTITLVATMQPYFALTWTRALERIGGTVVGGVLAAAVSLVVHTPIAIAVALFPLAVLALSVRAVSFGLFMVFLTPLVVLLSELGEPGTGELTIAVLRAGFTLAGGVLAVAGCLLLWPSWEPGRLADEVRGAIAAHRAYAAAVLGGRAPEALAQARRAAGLASNNIEASLQRALLEPGAASQPKLEAALLIDAALRRMAGRLAVVQLEPGLAEALPAQVWTAWRGWIDAAMAALAEGRAATAGRPATPPGRVGAALGRLARQIELMAGAIARVGL